MNSLYPSLKKSYILRSVKNNIIETFAVYSLIDIKSIEINKDMFELILLLTGQYSISEIAQKIMDKYNIALNKAIQKTRKSINELVSMGCVHLKKEMKLLYKFPNIKNMKSALDNTYIRLTNKCNLKCKHCSVNALNKGSVEIPDEKVYELIDQLYELMVPRVTFTGGEPTLKKNLHKYIKYANNKPMIVGLLTNGFTITRRYAQALVESGLKQVNISIDGATSEIHDDFRGVNGSFDNAVKAIEYFKQFNIFVETTTTLHTENEDEIDEIIILGKKLKIDKMKFLPIIPFNRGKQCNFNGAFNVYSENIEKLFPYLISDSEKIDIDMDFKPEFKYSSRCNAGSGVLAIDSDGSVLPCNNFDTLKLGNIYNESIYKIYSKATGNKILKKAIQIEGSECENCKYLIQCKGGCAMVSYSYFNDYNKCDITRKEIVKEFVKRMEKGA